MTEPSSSRTPWRRNLLPALLLTALVFPAASFLVHAPDGKTTAVRVDPAAGNPPVSSTTRLVPATPVPVAAAAARVVVRQTPLGLPDESAWRRSLKPRTLFPKALPVPPPGNVHRLLVKFVDPLEARAGRDGTLSVTAGKPGPTSALSALADSLRLRFRPLQTADDVALSALRKRAEIRSGSQQPDPQSLVEVIAEDSSPATVLAAARALLPLAAVEYVEIESADAPPPPPAADVSPATPALVSYQTYRGTSPGIGVDFVRDTYGVTGDPGLRITDCEYQFNPAHEDLAGLVSLQPGVASMYSGYGADHGTAATGILAAGDNAYGVTGSAPLCQMRFYPEYAVMADGSTQFRTATITAALAASAPGDIVMLEMQATGPNGKLGPAEYSLSVWNAVKTGTDAGVIVIAAAGNDHENLDASAWQTYRSRGNSGAIIVGAGDTSRTRLPFSTYGSRVDLQAWGAGVATTGYGSLMTCGNDPNQRYTQVFNGTSAATPIVASAAALLQSVAIRNFGTRLSPAEMRSLLVASGSPQTACNGTPIGPLPDLTAAVPQLLARNFTSAESIPTPGAGQGNPSSTIRVSGVNGPVSTIRVRIDGLTHSEPRDLAIQLVSPAGNVVTLMSRAGSSYPVTNLSLMFDDAASTVIPASSAIVPGRYRPADYGTQTQSTGTASTLAALTGGNPNGDWNLRVTDEHQEITGSIASWSVSFETTAAPGPRQLFDDWASASGLPDTDAAASPFGDGVSNLLKYAFNLNASGPDSHNLTPGTGTSGLPTLSTDQAADPPVFRLEYLRRKDSGLIYTALQMADPANGPHSPMEGSTHITDIDSDWERVAIEQTIDPLTPRRFFSVEVTLPDAPP